MISLNIGLSKTGSELQSQFANYIDKDITSKEDGAIKAYGGFGFALLSAPFTHVKKYCVSKLSKEIIEVFTGKSVHKSVEEEIKTFVGAFETKKLKEDIKIEKIGKPTIDVKSKSIMDDISRWKEQTHVNIKEAKDEIEKSRKRIEDKIKGSILKRVKELTNEKDLTFVNDFLDTLDSKVRYYITAEAEGVEEISKELIENKEEVEKAEENVKGELKNVFESWKPLWMKRKTLEGALDDYIDNLLRQFEYELEIKRMEEIRQLYNDIRGIIGEEGEKKVVEGIIASLDDIKRKKFMDEEVREKGEIERRGDDFEDKVMLSEDDLEELYDMDKVAEAEKLKRQEHIYDWKDLEKEEIYKRIEEFSEGEVNVKRSIIEFLKKKGKLQDKVKRLYDGIEMLWELKPGYNPTEEYKISIIGIEKDKSNEIERYRGTQVLEGADDEVIMLAQFQYCVPASAYKEVDACKEYYDIQSEIKDLHTDYYTQFKYLKEIKEEKEVKEEE